ncbi:MAG: hypothetical protein HC904_15230 [Blastochloris sp.]|nr:hypothetical protein [Blastochloris sp.]
MKTIPRPGKTIKPNQSTAEVKIEGYVFTSAQISFCFSLAAVLAIAHGLWHVESLHFGTLSAYYLILFAWLIPTGLWCFGYVHGIPLYPVFCSVNFIAFGLPLLTEHPWVVAFPPEAHLEAAFMVSTCLLSGGLVWFLFTRQHGQAPALCLQMNEKGGEVLMLTAMFLSLFFHFNRMAGLFYLEGGLFSLFRGVADGLGMLGTFVLAQRMGSGRLDRRYTGLYLLCLFCNGAIQITSLLLINVFPSRFWPPQATFWVRVKSLGWPSLRSLFSWLFFTVEKATSVSAIGGMATAPLSVVSVIFSMFTIIGLIFPGNV